MDCVLRYNSQEVFLAALSALGFDAASEDVTPAWTETIPSEDPEGEPTIVEHPAVHTPRRTEDIVRGATKTPELITANGDHVVCLRLNEEQAALLPTYVSPPEFVCDWRSDEVDEDGNLFPWPEYDCERNEYDEQGNVTGIVQYKQPVGRIS